MTQCMGSMWAIPTSATPTVVTYSSQLQHVGIFTASHIELAQMWHIILYSTKSNKLSHRGGTNGKNERKSALQCNFHENQRRGKGHAGDYHEHHPQERVGYHERGHGALEGPADEFTDESAGGVTLRQQKTAAKAAVFSC